MQKFIAYIYLTFLFLTESNSSVHKIFTYLIKIFEKIQTFDFLYPLRIFLQKKENFLSF